eukprot:gb/GFBE01082671.1/.p1 GENE.gb/GFBE01082671.1/~~gb/GFBE01082671.1/.p1  ORF type:complete len:248 (+),score=18.43 gb/GFBE01082671.1/:1-744(+)
MPAFSRQVTGGTSAEDAWREALEGYREITAEDLRPQLSSSDDPGQQLDQVRKWALSLTVPRSRAKAIAPLPPLRTPEDHQMDPFRHSRMIEDSQSISHMESSTELHGYSLQTLMPSYSSAVSDAPVNDILEEPGRPWPPKVSQLGRPGFKKEAPGVVRGLQSQEAAQAVARVEAMRSARTSRRMLVGSRMLVPPAASSVGLSHRKAAPGSDPMAGSLFSRDVVLDDETRRRGLYEGQLRRRPPHSAR